MFARPTRSRETGEGEGPGAQVQKVATSVDSLTPKNVLHCQSKSFRHFGRKPGVNDGGKLCELGGNTPAGDSEQLLLENAASGCGGEGGHCSFNP